MRRLGSLVIGILLLIGLASMFLVPAADILYSVLQNRLIHKPVQGFVVRAEVGYLKASSASTVVYAYSFGGNRYSGSQVGPGFLNGYSPAGGAIAKELAPGDALTVFVNPSAPSSSLLVRGVPSFSLGWCLALGSIIFRPRLSEGESLWRVAVSARAAPSLTMLLGAWCAVSGMIGPFMPEVLGAALCGAPVAVAVVSRVVSDGRGMRSVGDSAT